MMETIKKIWIWFLPSFMLATILLSAIPGQEDWLGFTIAFIPMLLGGGIIAYKSLLAILETRTITAGIMVVITIVGCAYLGFYQAAALVALMMFIGEFLEEITLAKTRKAVQQLMDFVPDTATVWRNEAWQTIDADDIRTGEVVWVRAGERIPVDGKVVKGEGAVNQSALTGESLPVDKQPGDAVLMGTINEYGSLHIETEKIGSGTVMGKVIEIVYEAEERKGPTQKIADQFAKYFTPLILVVATVAWLATSDIVRTMTILVIACPCALVLATPTAAVASIGNLAKRGVLIKGGKMIEALSKVDVVCVDKTGTITSGQPKVVEFAVFGDQAESDVLQWAAAVEQHSEHPLARAIVDYAKENGGFEPKETDSFTSMPGAGVHAVISGTDVWIGNEKVVSAIAGLNADASDAARRFISEQQQFGRTALVVIVGHECAGGFAIADTVRPEASFAVSGLRQEGIRRIVMLTGDNEAAAQAVARQAGIDEVRSALLPADKLEYIRELQKAGHVVAMVGDGVNDAPALMLADVGISMAGRGTDIAIESSGVALMGDQLQLLPEVLKISRRAMQLIRQNIWGFAVGFNVVGIALAVLGLISPVMGAIIHNIASLFVVMNSARMITYRRKVQFTVKAEPVQA
ncbi:heavy metal translocating P-type ATPase [Paenibacillus allorhizosphaerae]|uniref:Cd(2+)-exporting ATPase n=1 Tax=Paenibacillus allorhizosphaerae TaxID=2849866 RepID=A0ABM8VCM1_9BACL|nr:cation-translocating P-type ATPase [Paenibacillus allorhizosphaerae]CAG7622588.1 Cadmium-transporting ATPase [Paenibacillus allorhizosphaerae]